MKLLVVSHTPHYWKDGLLVGWGPTVREVDHLATLFDEVAHVAPVHDEPPPLSALAYRSLRVRFSPVRPAGGERLIDKLGIIARAPSYIRALLREFRAADVVQVRCPANISLIAIVLLALVRRPRLRWVKYAGDWQPKGGEPWSYSLQRWWLNRGLHRGAVTVNGQWPDQAGHVYSFLNPCLTDEEVLQAAELASQKELPARPSLLYVGRMEKGKGGDRALRALSCLERQGLSATLDLVGDGPERDDLERLANALGVDRLTTFHGWLPRRALAPLYARSHIMVFPSSSEGWPKVLGEAMAHGVVPLSSNVGSIPQYLSRFGAGRALDPDDVDAFARAVAWYCSHPAMWKAESERGVHAAHLFSYTSYLTSVQKILDAKTSN